MASPRIPWDPIRQDARRQIATDLKLWHAARKQDLRDAAALQRLQRRLGPREPGLRPDPITDARVRAQLERERRRRVASAAKHLHQLLRASAKKKPKMRRQPGQVWEGPFPPARLVYGEYRLSPAGNVAVDETWSADAGGAVLRTPAASIGPVAGGGDVLSFAVTASAPGALYMARARFDYAYVLPAAGRVSGLVRYSYSGVAAMTAGGGGFLQFPGFARIMCKLRLTLTRVPADKTQPNTSVASPLTTVFSSRIRGQEESYRSDVLSIPVPISQSIGSLTVAAGDTLVFSADVEVEIYAGTDSLITANFSGGAPMGIVMHGIDFSLSPP